MDKYLYVQLGCLYYGGKEKFRALRGECSIPKMKHYDRLLRMRTASSSYFSSTSQFQRKFEISGISRSCYGL